VFNLYNENKDKGDVVECYEGVSYRNGSHYYCSRAIIFYFMVMGFNCDFKQVGHIKSW